MVKEVFYGPNTFESDLFKLEHWGGGEPVVPDADTAYFEDPIRGLSIGFPHSFIALKGGLERTTFSDDPTVKNRTTYGERIHNLGGGVYEHTVSHVTSRANAGDAEYYAWNSLALLGRMGVGNLAIHGKLYTNCYFTGGTASIQLLYQSTHVFFALQFLRGLPTGVGLRDSGGSPGIPGTYPSRNSNQDYTYKGVALGQCGVIEEISCNRPATLVNIPRADGIRIKDRTYGREMMFKVRGYIHVDSMTGKHRKDVEVTAHDLFYNLRGDGGNLVGQGNTFSNVYLMDMTTPTDDSRWTAGVDFSFRQMLEATND